MLDASTLIKRTYILGGMTLADRIKEARFEAGISEPAELARRAGVKPAAAYQWESGATKTLKGETLVELADILAVEARWLATGKGPKQRNQSQTDMRSQPERLDARKIAETAKALRIVFARRGATFDIEKDADIFVVAYELRLQLPDRLTDEDMLDFGLEMADKAHGSVYGREDRDDAGSADRAPPKRSVR